MRSRKSQRGVALIMAILMVALAVILAVSVASEGYMDQRRTSTTLAMDQAFELGLGAEALAGDILLDDAKNSKTDTLTEAWATPIMLPVDDGIGTIQGNLEDLQGRFNLNNLLNQDGTPNEEGIRQFQRILELTGLESKWARIIVDWIDADTNPQFPEGAEDSVYAGQTPAYLTPNMPITRTSELLSLVNFGADNYRKLEPYIAALPIGSSINVCTAKAVVLDSLSTNTQEYTRDASVLKKGRESGCFPNLQTLDSTLSADVEYKKLKAKANTLTETTNYFRAHILVTLGPTEFTMYTTLRRGADGRVQPMQRSFGTV